MKKIITGIIAVLLASVGSLSAHVITVNNNGANAAKYTSLQAATNAAKYGDTIYVMGSPSSYGNDTIKTAHLTIIGAGYNTTASEINYGTSVGYIYLNGAVHRTRLEGLYIASSIQQVGTVVPIDSVDIERCLVSSTMDVCGPYWIIRNNDIDNVNVQDNLNVLIQNNFLQDVGSMNSATDSVDHNDFATYSGNVTAYSGATSNAVFSSNVFYYCSPENTTSCRFVNNLTVSSSVISLNNYIASGNTGVNNLYTTTNPGWADAAIPASTVTFTTIWNYYWNFSASAHAYDSAVDGTQIGAYGGNYIMPNLNGFAHIPQMIYMNASGVVLQSNNAIVNYKGQGKMAHGVAGGEYFFDTDPGTDLGTHFTVTNNLTDSATGTLSIAVSSLSAGFHTLGVRVEDSINVWSLPVFTTIYVQPVLTSPSPALISAAEYFVDVDPGQGKGTPITFSSADTVTISQSIALSSLGLTHGYHNLFIRVENANGQWSLYSGRNFYIQPSVTIPSPPSIVSAEYFVDIDPGQGKGTPITTGTADTVLINQSIAVNSLGLSSGNHNLFIRTENANGSWSLYAGRNFFITPAIIPIPPASPIVAAEYFFDTDPGQGKGKPIAVTKADSINITNNLSLTGLITGYHNLFIRTQDSTGSWSLYAGRNFYIQPVVIPPPPSLPIVAAEYFFDTDPGQGKGVALSGITSADTINIITTLNSSALALGNHNAFIRVKDSIGHWSLYAGRAFKVENCSDIVTVSATKDSCFGGNDGTATAIPSGGTGLVYTYSWSTTPAQTTSVATALAAGVYTITVLDSIGCPATNTVVVGQPTQIIIKTSTSPATCGQINGQATVTKVTGGTGTKYTYAWSTVPVQTTQAITGLAPGTYTVTVYDQNNCSNTATVTLGSTTAPSITVNNPVTPSICGEHIGAASVTVTGDAPPYKYSWNNGNTLASADSLHSGNYIVTVTDTNGCSTFVAIAITNSNGPIINSNGINEVKCYGQSNGSIAISVTGGAAPLAYAWSTGATTQNINNLQQGPYYVTVTDATGCSGISTFNITQPTSPVSGTISVTNSDCTIPDGTASIVAAGGTSPYTYNWSSGVTTTTANALGAGAYTIAITDANGCIDSVQAAVSSKTGPVVTVDSTIASTCASGGKGTGSIIISVIGGTGSDTYLWSDAGASTTKNLTNTPTGTYNVIVTDQVGCQGIATANIGEVAPTAIQICMVTVDTSSKYNDIIWNKSTAKAIESYNVYKEVTAPGVFTKIGSVKASLGGTFVDTNSDPNIQSWRYEISQVDSCGFESPLSLPHKTMHLTINQGINDTTYNLIWDNYQGLAFNYYIMYKDTAPGVPHDSIGNVLNNGTFTYTVHIAKKKPWYCHVAISNPGGCNPAIDAVNYNTSKSNTGNITFNTVGINTINADLNSLNIFPNPSRGVVNFTMNLTSAQSINLKIYNELGQVLSSTDYGKLSGNVSKELNLSGLSKGVYILKVTGQNGSVYKKVVLQ